MVYLPNVLTTPQQLKNRKKEPAHCTHATTPPLGILEVGWEGRTSGLDFPSVLLSLGFSSVEAMFEEFSRAYHLMYSESSRWTYPLISKHPLKGLIFPAGSRPLISNHPWEGTSGFANNTYAE